MLLFKLWGIVLLLVVAFICLGTYELFKYLGWPPPKALPKVKAVQRPKTKVAAQRLVAVEKEKTNKPIVVKIAILQLVIIASYTLLKGLDSVVSFILG